MFVVTGMHRSGTTFVGKILDACDDLAVFHEPFNRHFGLKGIAKNYPAVDDGYESYATDLLSRLARLEKMQFVSDCQKDSAIKAVVRKVIGGKSEQQWRRIRMTNKFRAKTLVLKDPFLSLSTQTLTTNLEYKVVFLCRHPVAVWSSIQQMDWRMDLGNFFGEDFPLSEADSEIERFCQVWSVLNAHNMSIANPNFLFVTHEALCLTPQAEFERIFNHLGIAFTQRPRARLNEMSSGATADKKGAKLHQFKRNSAEIIHAWKRKVPQHEQDYILTHAQVRPLVNQLY